MLWISNYRHHAVRRKWLFTCFIFNYCDATWLSDLLTLAWQNSSQIKETLIKVYFDFFTEKNLWVEWSIGHCIMSDSYLVTWKITLEKKLQYLVANLLIM